MREIFLKTDVHTVTTRHLHLLVEMSDEDFSKGLQGGSIVRTFVSADISNLLSHLQGRREKSVEQYEDLDGNLIAEVRGIVSYSSPSYEIVPRLPSLMQGDLR